MGDGDPTPVSAILRSESRRPHTDGFVVETRVEPRTPGPMHIQDIFRDHRTTFSFEFFPPKTEAASNELFTNIARLQELQPSFVSVTYGAGGSTRALTH